METETLVRRYFEVVGDLASEPADLEPLLHPELEIRTHPNLVSPTGSVRGRDGVIEGFVLGKQMLSAQEFDVAEVLVAAERAACKATWTGTLAIDTPALPSGTTLVAEIAALIETRDGMLYRQESFDCYRPIESS